MYEHIKSKKKEAAAARKRPFTTRAKLGTLVLVLTPPSYDIIKDRNHFRK